MKTLRLLIALSIILLPATASAADFRTEKQGQVWISDEVINDNLYVGAGSASIDSTVNGDVFVGAGQADISGDIKGDLFVGSGNVRVSGKVAGDVRIGGGNVRIEGPIGGELLVGGGSVEIADGASIAGNTYIGAGQLVIAGTTANVKTQTDSLHITSTAHIKGDLTYASAKDAQIDSGAVITGNTTHKNIPARQEKKELFARATLFGGGVLWIVLNLIMVLLFAYVFPNKSLAVTNDWEKAFLKNLGAGFVFLVVTPIAMIVLLISLVGIPLALVSFAVYMLVCYAAALLTAIVLGAWVRKLVEKSSTVKVDWISAVLGLVLLGLIKLIPILGGLASFILFLAALGALVRYDWGIVTNLRKSKKI